MFCTTPHYDFPWRWRRKKIYDECGQALHISLFPPFLVGDNFLLITNNRKDHIFNRQKTAQREKHQTTSDLEVTRVTALYYFKAFGFFALLILTYDRSCEAQGTRDKIRAPVRRNDRNVWTQGRGFTKVINKTIGNTKIINYLCSVYGDLFCLILIKHFCAFVGNESSADCSFCSKCRKQFVNFFISVEKPQDNFKVQFYTVSHSCSLRFSFRCINIKTNKSERFGGLRFIKDLRLENINQFGMRMHAFDQIYKVQQFN